MLKRKSSVSKAGLYIGLTVIIIMALCSYYYTGSFVEGMQPIIEGEIVEPLKEKLNVFIDENMAEVEMSMPNLNSNN